MSSIHEASAHNDARIHGTPAVTIFNSSGSGNTAQEGERGAASNVSSAARSHSSPVAPNSPQSGTATPLHPNCAATGKRLLYILNNLLNLPKHATTLLIGDSLAHCINKAKVDAETDSFRVRSVGGLCIPAAVEAMRRHKRLHNNVKRIIWQLGTNDWLHRANHCYDEEVAYLKALEVETTRLFPNAVICFILPYRGMKNLNNNTIKTLETLIKANCRKFKCFTPPSLKNKVTSKGIHPNQEGIKVLTEFFAKRFTPRKPRPFTRGSGTTRPGTTYAEAHLPATATDPVYPPRPPQPPAGTAHHAPFNERIRAQPTNSAPPINPAVWDMATVITRMLLQHNGEATYTQRPWPPY